MLLELLMIPTSLFLGLILLWYIHYFRYYTFLKVFPGPTPWPIVGSGFGRSSTDVLPKVLEGIKKFGDVVRIIVGFRHILIIADPKFAEFVLTSNKLLSKSKVYKLLHPWLGAGLLTSTGNKWKTHRKLLTPAFHFKILEQFIEVFHSASDVLITKLEKEVGKGSVNIYPYITLCALDIICESTMGTAVFAQEHSDSEYIKSVKEMLEIITERALSPIKFFDFTYQFTRTFQREKRALKVLHDYSNSIIKRRRQELPNNVDITPDDFGKKKKLAFLDILLQSTANGDPLSDRDIREEVDTFMFEGHDTTAAAMAFTLFCLADNPEVQEKVMEEINTIFENDKSRAATYNDLQEMRYLEMVIKETMRIYPSVPHYGRLLTEDVEYDGHILPTGTSLTVFAYAIGQNAEIFPEPQKFDPERFSPENTVGRHPFAYIPFSAGFRNCIGQKFAMLEMKSTISKVLRNYELHPTNPRHEMLISAEAVLRSANGVCVRLSKRNV